ncbi:hypothetical protein SAMN04487764_1534 [Gillisia sp. Hel1_33_143]|uniref:hypothetical protein n=1 Tax=Gillisia sp. Hel1_33_143 TaxID=1336796 RepID=UPI00087C5F28|nr:hypothetical protein [Gillisia sp. Hel1_33_143]SDS13656.1 hypothetical protein SAMN04487764_1534 [Gillisia sp. Hel1_33_143]
MQLQESSQQMSIGSLMRQNLELLPQGSSKSPTKKAYKYPYMDSEAINTTIQNAKKFAEAYNKAQDEKSSGIQKINRELRLALKSDPHTTEQKVLFQEYKQQEKISGLEPMAYNQKVLEFNRAHGTHYFMRTYKKLKSEIAVTFAHLVFFYAAQIRSNNARKLNAGVTTAGTLPRLLTNSENIKRYKVEGVPQCPFQNDAILNHVHNLVEAGILIKYKSHGRNMGFSVAFNPEILEVKDQNFTKLQNANSQLVVKFKTGKPTYSDCNTRTGENDNENKGDAVGSPQIRNVTQKSVTTSATGNNYRVTKSEENPEPKASADTENLIKNSPEVEKKQEQVSPGREKNVPIHFSEELENRIQNTWTLSQELSQNVHVHHVPPMEKLEWEARNGILSQPVFSELIFQEFMKVISRLKRENQSAAGAFYRGFEELADKKLKNFSGRYYDKKTMLAEFKKWLWMVDHAERWGKKRDWQFLYINDYLDTQRRDAKEVGFWYLEKQFKANEKKKETRKKNRLEKQQKHQARKKKIKLDRVDKFGYRSVKPGTNEKSLSDYEKARAAVRKYLYGKIPFEELHRYCRHNLNKTIVDGLKNLIDAEAANLNKYNA